MYYVNEEQIHARLAFIPTITSALRELGDLEHPRGLIDYFAQERALHLAIEVVTDVGSLMIDGFLMRDASSYEDIVEILRTEGVFPGDVADRCVELVGLRRALTQEYMALDRSVMRNDLTEIADCLERFGGYATEYIKKELSGFK